MREICRCPGFSMSKERVVSLLVGLGARVKFVIFGSVIERGCVWISMWKPLYEIVVEG